MADRKSIQRGSVCEARKAALAAGQTSFVVPCPCARGHYAKRWTANGSCSECMRADRAHHKVDKDKRRAYQRRGDANRDPAARSAWRREWEASRSEIIREQRLLRRQKRREHYSAMDKAKAQRYARRHPEIIRMLASRRRAQKRKARAGSPESLRAFSKWARITTSIRCYWCKRKTARGDRHIDHIIPLSRGGADAVDNLCVSCPQCNSRKGAKMPEDFTGQSEMRLA